VGRGAESRLGCGDPHSRLEKLYTDAEPVQLSILEYEPIHGWSHAGAGGRMRGPIPRVAGFIADIARQETGRAVSVPFRDVRDSPV